MSASTPFRDTGDGFTVAVRVSPKASRNAVCGIEPLGEGGTALKIKVTATPEDGKANAAVIKLLAKTWKIPKGALDVTTGATTRNKVLSVSCDANAERRIKDWFRSQEEENEQG